LSVINITLIGGASLTFFYKKEHLRTRRWTWSNKMTRSNLMTPTIYCTVQKLPTRLWISSYWHRLCGLLASV